MITKNSRNRRIVGGLLIAALLAIIGFCFLPVADSNADAHLFGYTPDPQATEAFVATLPAPEFSDAAPQLVGNTDGKDVFLYRSLHRVYKEKHGKDWVVGAQGIGDCVSWGWAHAVNVHLAVLHDLGETGEWREGATEPIYGGSRVEARGRTRGGYADGSYGGSAASWVKNFGVIFRQDYPDSGVDLTVYSAARAKDWGNFGNGGRNDNGRLDAEAKKHPVLDVTLVTNFEEAAAAISNGYPVPVCSGVGFEPKWGNVRDAAGFARARGGWSHCMCFDSVRYGDRPGLLCQNSWGPRWVSGPKYPADQPDGSFWVDKDTVNRMLAGRDSFAVSGMRGFPRNDLSHGDWVDVVPRRRFLEQPDFDFAIAP